MSSRTLVTGGAGFIGSALVIRLLDEGHEVVVLDNFWRGTPENLASVASNTKLTIVEGDVAKAEDLQRCFEVLGGIDLVHHLAAINGTKWFHEAAIDVIDTNVNGTLSTVRKAMEWGARYVLASSPEAFGENEQMPLRAEDVSRFPPAATHQRFSYGASKYLNEVAVHHAVRQGLDGRIVRPYNAYGVNMLGSEYGQVVGVFFQAVLEQRPLVLHGDGSQTRCFTHIDDVVEGFYLAGHLDVGVDGTPLNGESFNLGSTEETSVRALAEAVNRTVGTLAVDGVFGEGYHGDSNRRVPDIAASQSKLGWTATTLLDEGLALMWRRFQTGP